MDYHLEPINHYEALDGLGTKLTFCCLVQASSQDCGQIQKPAVPLPSYDR